MANKKHPYDQIVYLLQGGGALGSYQAGVCEALLEHDCAPDWVVGTSIGAIIDFDLINQNQVRLTLGAVRIKGPVRSPRQLWVINIMN